jgi:hypothetical protein
MSVLWTCAAPMAADDVPEFPGGEQAVLRQSAASRHDADADTVRRVQSAPHQRRRP